MDPSSVITQVTPDNNDASHLFTVQKGNGVQQKGKLHNLQNQLGIKKALFTILFILA